MWTLHSCFDVITTIIFTILIALLLFLEISWIMHIWFITNGILEESTMIFKGNMSWRIFWLFCYLNVKYFIELAGTIKVQWFTNKCFFLYCVIIALLTFWPASAVQCIVKYIIQSTNCNYIANLIFLCVIKCLNSK